MLLRTLIVSFTLAASGAASLRRPPSRPHTDATVSGMVRDSLSHTVLAGAGVQLVGNDSGNTFSQTVMSDSLGRFAFHAVPDGKFLIGFFHPVLDSLGIEPSAHALDVHGGADVFTALSTPSPGALRRTVCQRDARTDARTDARNVAGGGTRGEARDSPSSESGALVMGFVRHADGRRPADGARVQAEWLEMQIGTGGVRTHTARRAVTTRENGWYALCDMPSPGSIRIIASLGPDSSDLVDLSVPADGFYRNDVYVGVARPRTIVAAPGETSANATNTRTQTMQTGDGIVRGSIITALGGQPLIGARVRVVGGPETTASTSGTFTLADAPTGTRTIEARAVGYYPERRTVNIVDGEPPLRIALATLKSVLDTIVVTATREHVGQLRGFQSRSRSGLGRFITTADVARLQPVRTSELFRQIPGVYINSDTVDQQLVMRGVFEDRCAPSYFLNGYFMSGFSLDELDTFVRPGTLAGIEVYATGQVPAQFQQGLTGCGSIVMWTR